MAWPALKRIRLATLLLPPLGLVMLWRSGELKLKRKLLGTLGALLYSILYASLIIFILMQTVGLEIEWRGGFPPVLTFAKTKPDYAAVEAHRERMKQAALVLTNVPSAASYPYWTDFRGPNRDGHYAEKPILTNWPAGGLRMLWRQPIGGGYASFVIAEGRAFTIEQRREREAVTAYDGTTGRELWAHTYPAQFSESMGGEGPRATPTYHDGRIYSLGAEGEFVCLDAASGRVHWRKDLLVETHASNLYFALSASPLIVDDKVIVLSGGVQKSIGARTNGTVVAYDRLSGREIWAAFAGSAAYTSPMLVNLAGQRQVLALVEAGMIGLNPDNGELLWESPWRVQYNNAIAQPLIVSSNGFVISAGYGTGAALIEVSKMDSKFTARQVWKNQNLKTKFNSAVFLDGYIYGLDEGILTCIDAATGRRQWKDGRYGYGQLLLASGHLIVLSGEGELILVRADPKQLEEVTRFQAIKGKSWNHPAIADGKIFVRNAVEMACFAIDVP
jgi:outer membrane protein assembly factor BamB